VPFYAGFDGRAKIRNVRLHLIVGTFGKEVLKIGWEVVIDASRFDLRSHTFEVPYCVLEFLTDIKVLVRRRLRARCMAVVLIKFPKIGLCCPDFVYQLAEEVVDVDVGTTLGGLSGSRIGLVEFE
jgi:hypothetical protein